MHKIKNNIKTRNLHRNAVKERIKLRSFKTIRKRGQRTKIREKWLRKIIDFSNIF
jgi:hypothetical protein